MSKWKTQTHTIIPEELLSRTTDSEKWRMFTHIHCNNEALSITKNLILVMVHIELAMGRRYLRTTTILNQYDLLVLNPPVKQQFNMEILRHHGRLVHQLTNNVYNITNTYNSPSFHTFISLRRDQSFIFAFY